MPLKLLVKREPPSHSSSEMPAGVGVFDREDLRLPASKIADVIIRASTTREMSPPASKRRQFRRLFFVMKSCNREKSIFSIQFHTAVIKSY